MKFPGITDFSDLRQTRCARKIPKPVLETTLWKLIYEKKLSLAYGKKITCFLLGCVS
jgi:hypothetical protein